MITKAAATPISPIALEIIPSGIKFKAPAIAINALANPRTPLAMPSSDIDPASFKDFAMITKAAATPISPIALEIIFSGIKFKAPAIAINALANPRTPLAMPSSDIDPASFKDFAMITKAVATPISPIALEIIPLGIMTLLKNKESPYINPPTPARPLIIPSKSKPANFFIAEARIRMDKLMESISVAAFAALKPYITPILLIALKATMSSVKAPPMATSALDNFSGSIEAKSIREAVNIAIATAISFKVFAFKES